LAGILDTKARLGVSRLAGFPWGEGGRMFEQLSREAVGAG